MPKKPTYEELERRVKELEKVADERRRTSKVFLASDQEKEAILNSLMEHVIYQDTEMRILWANRAACESANLPYEEIVGHYCYEIWPKRSDPCSDCPVIKAMEMGQPQVIEKSTPDGRYWFIRGYPLRDRNGDIVGGIEVTLEITELKQTEEAVRKSEHKYSALVQESPDAIISLANTGNLLSFNPAAERISGLSSEEVIGKHFTKIGVLAKQSIPKALKEFALVITGTKRPPFELTIMNKDKSYFFMEANPRLIKRKGEKAWIQVTLRDITDRKLAEGEKKKLEAQLQQAHKMEAIGTLASGFAHNFNNLLMGIIANTSIMLFDIDSNHQHYKYLKNIEKLVKSGSKVAIQFTGYARVKRYEFKPINMNQLLKETSDTFGMGKKKIRLHQNIAEKLHIIEADKEQLEQALLNLYINAVDAMPEGGDLFFKTMNVTDQDMIGKTYKPKPGKYVLLTVRDTGIGMDKKTKERVFEPFFTTKDFIQGTGLGLSSTYNIMKDHGGYIDVDSEKGVGTTFSIYLPTTEKGIKEEKEPIVEILKGKETILLVDDENAVIEGCREVLEKMGYIVSIAKNGREAIEIYRKSPEKVDLVILDIIMPGMGGGETYNRLKEINPDIKVLLTSGNSINGQANEILERGCNGFIQKPFNMEDLSRNMRGILDKK